MTSTYNRSQIYDASELDNNQKAQVMNDFCFEESDFYSASYAKFQPKNRSAEFIPLNMFIRTNLHGNKPNSFTHGVYGLSAFDGYFVTFNRSNDECVIAHKHF